MLFPRDSSGPGFSGGSFLGKAVPTDQGIHPDRQGPERDCLCGWSRKETGNSGFGTEGSRMRRVAPHSARLYTRFDNNSPQDPEGVCAGPEEEADQPSHDALDFPADGRHQLDALPRGSRRGDLDEGGPEKDHFLLLPGGEGDLRRSLTRYFLEDIVP